jgi:hypothetical protein
MKNQFGTPFSATATGSTGAYATATGIAGATYYITDIMASSDKDDSTVTVKDGTTNIWQVALHTATPVWQTFSTPIRATEGNSVTVSTDGSSNCSANVAGFKSTK